MTPPSDANDSRTQRVADFWAKAAEPDFRTNFRQTNWMTHPEVEHHVALQCSGGQLVGWFDYFLNTYVRPRTLGTALNLGCGEGILERELASKGFADAFEGFDLSAACVDRANETVGKEFPAARFFRADVNQIVLEPEKYDVALFSHSLHHIERLEYVCDQVRRAVRPDGFVLLQEFIGPSRMQ